MTPAKKIKPTILAIHGAGAHGGVWNGLAQYLDGYAVKALSLPGHATKDDGEPLTSIVDMAFWVKRQLAGTPEKSVILMGHSMGALVALEMADHPAVHSVVLLGAAARMPVNQDLLKTAEESPVRAAEMIVKWGVYAASPGAETVKGLLDKTMKAADRRALARDLGACNDYKRGEERAKTLHKPALVISGAEDKLTSADDGLMLANLIPGGRYYRLSQCGHMMMLENPLETAGALGQFLSETAVA